MKIVHLGTTLQKFPPSEQSVPPKPPAGGGFFLHLEHFYIDSTMKIVHKNQRNHVFRTANINFRPAAGSKNPLVELSERFGLPPKS